MVSLKGEEKELYVFRMYVHSRGETHMLILFAAATFWAEGNRQNPTNMLKIFISEHNRLCNMFIIFFIYRYII